MKAWRTQSTATRGCLKTASTANNLLFKLVLLSKTRQFACATRCMRIPRKFWETKSKSTRTIRSSKSFCKMPKMKPWSKGEHSCRRWWWKKGRSRLMRLSSLPSKRQTKRQPKLTSPKSNMTLKSSLRKRLFKLCLMARSAPKSLIDDTSFNLILHTNLFWSTLVYISLFIHYYYIIIIIMFSCLRKNTTSKNSDSKSEQRTIPP